MFPNFSMSIFVTCVCCLEFASTFYLILFVFMM